MTIVPIRSEEQLDTCAQLLVNAYNNEPWNDAWTPEQACAKLTCYFRSPQFLGWMLVDGDTPLGACVGNIEPYYTGDYFLLKDMFVPQSNQHRGIGSQLMTTLKTHLEGIGIHTIILFTSKDFFPFEFYLKHGFSEMEGMRMMHIGGA